MGSKRGKNYLSYLVTKIGTDHVFRGGRPGIKGGSSGRDKLFDDIADSRQPPKSTDGKGAVLKGEMGRFSAVAVLIRTALK